MNDTASPEHRTQTYDLHVGEALFDMDGTLVDSIPSVEDAWQNWASEEGIELVSPQSFHGRTAFDLVSALVPADRVEAALARVDELESASEVPSIALPGALELLGGLPRNRWSIVTSATRRVAVSRLASGKVPLPERLVSADDVSRGKPHPEPFARGRRWPSTRALAFEDTVAGLRSAREAGCLTVGILGTYPAEALRPIADYIVSDLSAVSLVAHDSSGLRLSLTGSRRGLEG